MTTDQAIEAAARAIDKALAYEVERDVLACDLTREEQLKVARAAAIVKGAGHDCD